MDVETALAQFTVTLNQTLGALDQRIRALEVTVGTAAPREDLPGWRQVISEDFDTDALPGQVSAAYPQFGAYPKTWLDTSKRGRYDPANLSVAEGVLRQRLHTVNGQPSVAALVPLLNPGSGTWGDSRGARVSLRMRCQVPLPGYKIAYLLWPASNNSAIDGEIDWPERNLDSPNVGAFVHHAPKTPDPAQFAAKPLPLTANVWHVFTTEWVPGVSVAFSLDGVEVARHTERIPNSSMHWVLQAETALATTIPVPASTDGFIEIDWIAAWVPSA